MYWPGMRNLLILTVALGSIACSPVEETEYQNSLPNLYFAIDSLVNHQQATVPVQRLKLIKEVEFNNQSSADTLMLDSARLVQELLILRELNLNFSSLRNQYSQTKETDAAGLAVLKYKARQPEALNVDNLVVYLTAGKVRRIEGTYTQRNYLYESERQIQGNFDEAGYISSIRVEGKQKMIFRDPVNYTLVSLFRK